MSGASCATRSVCILTENTAPKGNKEQGFSRQAAGKGLPKKQDHQPIVP